MALFFLSKSETYGYTQEFIARYARQQQTAPSVPYLPANEKIVQFHASPAKTRALFGGNRSGKSEAGGQEVDRLCLAHPGITAWACTVSFDAIGAYVQEKIFKYLPKSEIESVSWNNKPKRIPAVIRLKNDSAIFFKSYDQGSEKFQGASVNVIWLDEEPPEDIYNESLARTLDCGGRILLTMTPLKGLTWVYDRIYQTPNRDGDHIRHWTVSLFENRFIPEPEKQYYAQLYGADEVEKRIYGKFLRVEGAVWKEFQNEVNIVTPFDIPSDWRRIRAIDFGYTNPFVCLWLAMNAEQEIFIYREYYQAETLLQEHARHLVHDETEHIERTVADHDAQDRAELQQYGVSTVPANKDVQVGIQLVNRLWKAKPNGRPSLYVFANLSQTITEIRNYHYPKDKRNKNAAEVPEKVDDHTQDALRYGVMYFCGDGNRTPILMASPAKPPRRTAPPMTIPSGRTGMFGNTRREKTAKIA